jgi:hypothetical protein
MTLQRACVALVATALVAGMASPGHSGGQLSAAQGEAVVLSGDGLLLLRHVCDRPGRRT